MAIETCRESCWWLQEKCRTKGKRNREEYDVKSLLEIRCVLFDFEYSWCRCKHEGTWKCGGALGSRDEGGWRQLIDNKTHVN